MKNQSHQLFPQETRNRKRVQEKESYQFRKQKLKQGSSSKTFCKFHGTCGHTMDECTMFKSLTKQAKQKKSKHFEKKEKIHQTRGQRFGAETSQECAQTEKGNILRN